MEELAKILIEVRKTKLLEIKKIILIQNALLEIFYVSFIFITYIYKMAEINK